MTGKAERFVQLLRATKKERRLGTVIFFVTSRCNAKCETCFYHEELNRPGDMTFEQIERVSQTMPAITDLWLSGGEPTLRQDVDDIIRLFVENNGVRRVIIPTNGLLKSRTYALVDNALSILSKRSTATGSASTSTPSSAPRTTRRSDGWPTSCGSISSSTDTTSTSSAARRRRARESSRYR